MAERTPITKDTRLESLFGGRTPEGRRLAEEAMAPYLAEFQAAADSQFKQDFAPQVERQTVPPMAMKAASEVLDLVGKGPEFKLEVAQKIADHVRPLADMLHQLAARMAPVVSLLEESRRDHTADCLGRVHDHRGGARCTCGAEEWNKKVDGVLGETR